MQSMKVTMAKVAMAVALLSLATGAASPRNPMSKLENGLRAVVRTHGRARERVVTAWNGNKYVQCRRQDGGVLRCEAAGTRLQPSLAHVLTSERIDQLTTRGWRLDPNFGAYVQTFPAGAPIGQVMSQVVQALQFGYDADISALEVKTALVPRETCPRRNGYTQNLAGMINYAPTMVAYSITDCAYTPPPEPTSSLLAAKTAAAPAQHVIDLYGERLADDIRWMRLAGRSRRARRLVLDTGEGYVQCESNGAPRELYCEAVSADSSPDLAGRLTPDRIARLHQLGFADPGYAPNYSRTYPADNSDEHLVSAELLTLLHDVYAYDGSSALQMKTDTAP
jgi:hypothetical protein